MEASSNKPPSTASEKRQSGSDFGKFLVDLSGLLTMHIVLSLATYFEFSMAQKDKLESAEYAGQVMINYLQERGLIAPTNISPLIKALEFHHLDGLKHQVLASFRSCGFENHDTPNKLTLLQTFLKRLYKIFYKAVQPIPYVSDKVYCVDEVFVDSGIEVIKLLDTKNPSHNVLEGTSRSENRQLNSYRDIFDNNVIPSNRIIVEGEPGYGKSTLTLKAAYDWCKGRSSSPIAGFELFILLPFRLLKGITSINKAIKLFALPQECRLTEADIQEAISVCTSMVIVLDGFDEYPDMNSGMNSDMMQIIKGLMFADHKLVLLTRTGCLPKTTDPHTLRLRLTGFNDRARDQYIKMAVAGASGETANEIKKDLKENPVMSDLCQVPLFFVMFAHMSSDSKELLKCDSVTIFFLQMIRCLYSHMWKKEHSDATETEIRLKTDKSRLCKVAFESLTDENQTLHWEKNEFFNKTGVECCEELIKIGILVEEKLLNDITDTSSSLDYVPYTHVVRFYHKVFMEWYAAHHLSDLASDYSLFRNRRLTTILKRIDPQDVQFVFRFACGLNPVTFSSIFKYLQGVNDDVATLCIFEAASKSDEIKNVVKKMCSNGMVLKSSDSNLLQRSRIQLLIIASKNQIAITSVSIVRCFHFVELNEESLCLSSGLKLPILHTLQELVIFAFKDLRNKARDILEYSSKCDQLKTLKFNAGIYMASVILLPQSFDDKNILSRLHDKDCNVMWKPGGFGTWQLNLETGRWKGVNGDMLEDSKHLAMVEAYNRLKTRQGRRR